MVSFSQQIIHNIYFYTKKDKFTIGDFSVAQNQKKLFFKKPKNLFLKGRHFLFKSNVRFIHHKFINKNSEISEQIDNTNEENKNMEYPHHR